MTAKMFNTCKLENREAVIRQQVASFLEAYPFKLASLDIRPSPYWENVAEIVDIEYTVHVRKRETHFIPFFLAELTAWADKHRIVLAVRFNCRDNGVIRSKSERFRKVGFIANRGNCYKLQHEDDLPPHFYAVDIYRPPLLSPRRGRRVNRQYEVHCYINHGPTLIGKGVPSAGDIVGQGPSADYFDVVEAMNKVGAKFRALRMFEEIPGRWQQPPNKRYPTAVYQVI